MKTILITGSNGLVGQKLVRHWSADPEIKVIATSKSENRLDFSEGYTFELFDITNTAAAEYLFDLYKPDIVINAAALSSADYCEEFRDQCWKVNVEAVENIVKVSNKHHSHFIQISTDFIFDGTTRPYSEEDNPNPVNFYGNSKMQAETIVREYAEKWSVIRTVLVYGFVKNIARPNIVTWVKDSLEQGKHIKVVNDQYRTPTLAEDLAGAIAEVAAREKEGIYHISGNNYMSIIDIAYLICYMFGLDRTLITPVTTVSLNEKAMRPPRTGFAIEKAMRDLGYEPHTFMEGLGIIKEQMEQLSRS